MFEPGASASAMISSILPMRIMPSSLLHPARHPDAEWLDSCILKRSDQPFGIGLYQHISLIRLLPPGSHGMHQRDATRKQFETLNFSRQFGALEDASEKRAMQFRILGPAAKMHAIEGDVVRFLGKARRISLAVATR